MKNLLVAFEFDYTSRNAAKYAAAITRQSDMQMTLYHSFETMYPSHDLPYMQDDISGFQEDHSERMEHYVNKLKRRYDLDSIRWMVRPGAVTENLEEYIREEKTSLIVAGVNKKSLISDPMSDSTSYQLYRNTRLPVLVVPTKAKFTGIHRVMVACNLTDPEKEDFSSLLELQRALGFEIIVLGISQEKSPESVIADRKEFITKAFGAIPFSIILKKGADFQDIIEREVRAEKVDMLVVSPNDKRLLEGMAQKSQSRNLMNALSRTSLLFLPEKSGNAGITISLGPYPAAENLLRHVS